MEAEALFRSILAIPILVNPVELAPTLQMDSSALARPAMLVMILAIRIGFQHY